MNDDDSRDGQRLRAEFDALMARNAAADAVLQQSGYVRFPHPACAGGRCQAPALTGAAEQARTIAAALVERFDQEREQAMAMTPGPANPPCAALWCEEGGHSFSERDPGMKVVVIEGTDDSGAPVSESRTMCGSCAPKVNVRRTRPANMPGQAPLPMAAAPAWPAGYEVPAPVTAPAAPGWTPGDDGAPRL